MPPKQKDPKAKPLFKTGQALKDIVPAYCKNPPRDARPYKAPEQVPTIQRHMEYEPIPDPEEWPGDDAAKGFDFSQQIRDDFQWPFQYISLRRPKDFLR